MCSQNTHAGSVSRRERVLHGLVEREGVSPLPGAVELAIRARDDRRFPGDTVDRPDDARPRCFACFDGAPQDSGALDLTRVACQTSE
jgi:hypothetical protein